MTRHAFKAAVEVLTGPLRSPREHDLIDSASTFAGIAEAAKWIEEHREDVRNGRIFISNATGEVWHWKDAHMHLKVIVLEQVRSKNRSKLDAIWLTSASAKRHAEQLRYEHHNSDRQFLNGVYARYAEYCLRGTPVRVAWEVAFRDERNARTHAFQKRLRTMRLQVMQEFIKLDEGKKR